MSDIDTSIRKLQKARKTLQESQGRVARRNARRKVLGILRSIRYCVDSQYPTVESGKPKKDLLQKDIETLTWREFERKRVNIAVTWSPKAARAFNSWFCDEQGLEELPIKFTDEFAHETCGHSFHGDDAIWMFSGGGTPKDYWRALFHQLAHYRVENHPRRALVKEMAEVLESWKRYREELSRQASVKRIARKITSLKE